MAIGAIIDHLLVAMDSIDRRVRQLGSDRRHLLPGNPDCSFANRSFRDEMGAGRPVATKENVQEIILIRPNDRAEVVIGFCCFREPDGAGENPFGRVIGNEHGVGLALLVLGRGGIPVVYDVKPALQENRLGTLPTIVEHLELALPAKRNQRRRPDQILGCRLPETKSSRQKRNKANER